MSFLALLVLIWVFTRFGCAQRGRRWQRGYVAGWPAPRRFYDLRYEARPRTPAPRVSAFEVLKRKYVTGELTDDQYESALDRLLRTPEGRREVN